MWRWSRIWFKSWEEQVTCRLHALLVPTWYLHVPTWCLHVLTWSLHGVYMCLHGTYMVPTWLKDVWNWILGVCRRGKLMIKQSYIKCVLEKQAPPPNFILQAEWSSNVQNISKYCGSCHFCGMHTLVVICSSVRIVTVKLIYCHHFGSRTSVYWKASASNVRRTQNFLDAGHKQYCSGNTRQWLTVKRHCQSNVEMESQHAWGSRENQGRLRRVV